MDTFNRRMDLQHEEMMRHNEAILRHNEAIVRQNEAIERQHEAHARQEERAGRAEDARPPGVQQQSEAELAEPESILLEAPQRTRVQRGVRGLMLQVEDLFRFRHFRAKEIIEWCYVDTPTLEALGIRREYERIATQPFWRAICSWRDATYTPIVREFVATLEVNEEIRDRRFPSIKFKLFNKEYDISSDALGNLLGFYTLADQDQAWYADQIEDFESELQEDLFWWSIARRGVTWQASYTSARYIKVPELLILWHIVARSWLGRRTRNDNITWSELFILCSMYTEIPVQMGEICKRILRRQSREDSENIFIGPIVSRLAEALGFEETLSHEVVTTTMRPIDMEECVRLGLRFNDTMGETREGELLDTIQRLEHRVDVLELEVRRHLYKERVEELQENGVSGGFYFDYALLDAYGCREEVERMMSRQYWERLFSWRDDTYEPVVHEFIATFEPLPSNHYCTPSMKFNLFGRGYQLSIIQLGERLGLYTHEETMSEEWSNLPTDFDSDAAAEAYWDRITNGQGGRFTGAKQNTSKIVSPTLKMMKLLLNLTFGGRNKNLHKVYRFDLFHLWSLEMNEPMQMACMVQQMFHSQKNAKCPYVWIGPVVTRLCHGLGLQGELAREKMIATMQPFSDAHLSRSYARRVGDVPGPPRGEPHQQQEQVVEEGQDVPPEYADYPPVHDWASMRAL
nr:uncharacterized protein LOC110928595 [Ipomoea batatas]